MVVWIMYVCGGGLYWYVFISGSMSKVLWSFHTRRHSTRYPFLHSLGNARVFALYPLADDSFD